jgi:hypothetical protein
VIVVVSMLLMAAGAVLWLRSTEAQRKDLRSVDYLALALGPLILLALITSMLGIWFIGLILLVLSILTIVTIVTWVLS